MTTTVFSFLQQSIDRIEEATAERSQQKVFFPAKRNLTLASKLESDVGVLYYTTPVPLFLVKDNATEAAEISVLFFH